MGLGDVLRVFGEDTVPLAEVLYGFAEADAFYGAEGVEDVLVIHFLFGFHCGKEGDTLGAGALLDLQSGKAQGAFSQSLEEFSQRQTVFQFDVHIHTAGVAVEPSVPHVQEGQNNENYRTADESDFIQSDTQGQTHASGCPEACGSGQTFDAVIGGDNNGTCSKEADATDHLGAHAHRIPGAVDLLDILIGHHDDASTHTNQHVGAQSRRTVFLSALKADNAPQYNGSKKPNSDR